MKFKASLEETLQRKEIYDRIFAGQKLVLEHYNADHPNEKPKTPGDYYPVAMKLVSSR